MIFFWGFVSFVIIQRLVELMLAKRNARIMFSRGALELDPLGYRYIVLMHVLFFVSLIAEKLVLQNEMFPAWQVLFILFLLAQFLRYWAISSLGIFWNTRLIYIPGKPLVNDGPYRFLKHPNYIAVITEIAVIPLIFGCYATAFIFTLLNIIVLIRRIGIEDSALKLLKKAQIQEFQRT